VGFEYLGGEEEETTGPKRDAGSLSAFCIFIRRNGSKDVVDSHSRSSESFTPFPCSSLFSFPEARLGRHPWCLNFIKKVPRSGLFVVDEHGDETFVSSGLGLSGDAGLYFTVSGIRCIVYDFLNLS
jgi:hypothetical protein